MLGVGLDNILRIDVKKGRELGVLACFCCLSGGAINTVLVVEGP